MFNPTSCDRSVIKMPLVVNWEQFDWLEYALLLGLLLFAFFGLRQVIQIKRWKVTQARRWKRWLHSPKAFLFMIGFTAIFPLLLFTLAAKGLVVFIPPDSGSTAQAIVVLGRGGEFGKQRVEVAAQLWQAKRAPKIFTSGYKDAPKMLQRLEKEGIPSQAVDGENCSLTTAENAIFTAAILQQQGIERILLITDSPHMLRSLLVFRANGFTVIPHSSSLPSRLNVKAKIFLTLREYIGLISYGLRGLFFPQRSPESHNPELMNLLKKAEQYGQMKNLIHTFATR